MVKRAGYSSREQHLHGGSLSSVTPIPEDPMASSDLDEYCTYMVARHTMKTKHSYKNKQTKQKQPKQDNNKTQSKSDTSSQHISQSCRVSINYVSSVSMELAKCRMNILRKSRFAKLGSLPFIYIVFTTSSVLPESRGELMNRGGLCAETKAGQNGRVRGHGREEP